MARSDQNPAFAAVGRGGYAPLHPHHRRDARHVSMDGEDMHGWRFRPDKPFMGSSHGVEGGQRCPPPTAAPGQRTTTRLPTGSAFNKGDGSLCDSCFQPSPKPLYLSSFNESLESEC